MALPWSYQLVVANAFRPVPGRTAKNLPAKCQIQYTHPPVEAVNPLALTFPDMEMMRSWPWPVEQPWVEDEREWKKSNR